MLRSAVFSNRIEAGRLLAEALARFSGKDDAVVIGLARGGVPVAHEVATWLDLPLDVLVVRKLGVPGQEELAMGAIAAGGIRVLNEYVLSNLDHADAALQQATYREQRELERREGRYREGRPALDVTNRTAIVVDDGLATGATMQVAVLALRQRGAAQIVVAVPVGAPSVCEALRARCEQLVCLFTAEDFHAVSAYYDDFGQTSDAEVIGLLSESAQNAQSRQLSAADPRG